MPFHESTNENPRDAQPAGEASLYPMAPSFVAAELRAVQMRVGAWADTYEQLQTHQTPDAAVTVSLGELLYLASKLESLARVMSGDRS